MENRFNNTTTTKENDKIMLIEGEYIPRSESNRLKNYKCTFPGCKELPKTRYNCYTHVWDCHLRWDYAHGKENPKNLKPVVYKLSNQKPLLQKECSKYMIKLVETKNSSSHSDKTSNEQTSERSSKHSNEQTNDSYNESYNDSNQSNQSNNNNMNNLKNDNNETNEMKEENMPEIKQESSSSQIDDLPLLPNVKIPQAKAIERKQRIIHDYKTHTQELIDEQKPRNKYPFAFESNSMDFPTVTTSTSEYAMYINNSHSFDSNANNHLKQTEIQRNYQNILNNKNLTSNQSTSSSFETMMQMELMNENLQQKQQQEIKTSQHHQTQLTNNSSQEMNEKEENIY